MKYPLTVIALLISGCCLWAQGDAPQGCSKNISFAVAEGGGQPVPAIPKFTAKWLGGKSRKEGFPALCFSQVPSLTQTNYLVVFSTTKNTFEGLKASAHTYRSSGQGNDAPVNSYGGTWSFAYAGAAPPATDTLELKRDDKPKQVAVRAYDQGGRTVSQSDLGSISNRDKLLEKVFTDITKDAVPEGSRRSIPSQSPVYYVNCDVEGQPVSPPIDGVPAKASVVTAAAAAPAPPDPPKSELEIWSYPVGADVFLDGNYVGKTPYAQEVSPGEHTVDLRKKNFAIWQRKVQTGPGKRRIGGNLEQKVLELQ
jgi:PEGA domain